MNPDEKMFLVTLIVLLYGGICLVAWVLSLGLQWLVSFVKEKGFKKMEEDKFRKIVAWVVIGAVAVFWLMSFFIDNEISSVLKAFGIVALSMAFVGAVSYLFVKSA